MSEDLTLEDLKQESSERGKDPKTRYLLIILLTLWLVTLSALVGIAWGAYFGEKEKTLTLAEQIAFACANGNFGPGISPEDEKALCENAQEVIEENDPELQENEIQEAEIQDPEIQDPEIQDPEIQDPENQQPENQDTETQDPEEQDGEIQDPEIQDEEIQNPEIQDEETQDPEIDDPDPNDQIEAGSCTFDGSGTITFTFQTSSGPISFECTGTSPFPPAP